MKYTLASLKQNERLEDEAIAFVNAKLFTGSEVLDDHAIVVERGIIKQICSSSDIASNIKAIDVQGANISAGFIDLQLNGCGGVMFNDDISVQTLETMHKTNLKSGCTSFLPTLITSSDEDMKQAIEVMREYQRRYPNHSLGLHLEGPYISLDKKGIHNASFIRPADNAMVDYLCKHSAQITKITLAPENSTPQLIKRFTDAGIIVSLGHSNASYKETKQAFDAGATFATHLFNAMSPMQGREPGMLGAIYDNPDVYTGVIADGIHVDYANIRIAKKIKEDHLILVTDATAAAGASDLISFDFVGETVYVKEGKCVNADGTIGGSALTLDKAVYNAVKYAGFSLDEAVRMVTLYPSRAISNTGSIGVLNVGCKANLSIFDDSVNVCAVFLDSCIIKA